MLNKSPAEPLPSIDGYVVRERLGAGGMGVVYAATDKALDREVAIKVAQSHADFEMFERETKVTARLEHPGIPPVHACGKLADGRPFLVMKLIEGSHGKPQTLTDLLRAPKTPEHRSRLLQVFERVCDAVGYAHSKGIVHRDLKPGNIMVGPLGEVYVVDWGLAKELIPTNLNELTVKGQIKGTPPYMAPEQARGETVGAGADVFALGGILAAMLTSKPPFGGESPSAIVRAAAKAELGDCYKRLDECGADTKLIALAKECLQPDLASRYPNGTAVAAAFAQYQAGVAAQLVQAREKEAEQKRRRRVQIAFATASFVVVAGGLAFGWWQADVKRTRDLDAARAASEHNAEVQKRVDQARRAGQAALALAVSLRSQGKFEPAAVALADAARQAEGGGPELLSQIERARRDLSLVRELDKIRFGKWVLCVGRSGKLSFATQTAPAYRRVLKEAGADLAALDPVEGARWVTESAVRAELLLALDDWALREQDEQIRDRLLAVTRAVAPGVWSNRLRDPAIWGDKDEVARLAQLRDPDASPTLLIMLAELMGRHGLDPEPLLEAARLRHPSNFELNFALIWWSESYGEDPRRAVGPVEAARALRPDCSTVWLFLAEVREYGGDVRGARTAYQEAVRLEPSALAHSTLGMFLARQDNLDGALAEAQQAINREPGAAIGHSLFAFIHATRREHDAAVTAAQKAIACQPDSPLGQSMLAWVLGEKGDHDGALEARKAAARLAPKDAYYCCDLGDAFLDRGNFDSALVRYREAVRLNPKLSAAQCGIGKALAGKGDWLGAEAAHRQAIQLVPGYATAHLELGFVLQERGDRTGALAAYREALRCDPKFTQAHFRLGLALHIEGERSSAAAAFLEAAALDPKFAEAHYELARVLDEHNDLAGATAAYQAAIAAAPRFAEAHTNLGFIYHRQKQYPEAISCARKALEAKPDLHNAHGLLGRALRDSGDINGARAAFTEAARLDKMWESELTAIPK